MYDNIINEINKKYNRPKEKALGVSFRFPSDHKQSTAIMQCATSIFTTIFEHNQTKEHKRNLSFMTCKSKFCPLCNTIKQGRWSMALYKRSKELQAQGDKFLFMTLTIKNCKIENLSDTIAQMNEAWKRTWHKDLRHRFNGFVRVLEFTISTDENGEVWIHPHFHILLSAKKRYFYKSNKNYLRTDELSALWGKWLKVDYSPIVDIRTIKPKLDKNGQRLKEAIPAVIAELIKYPMKDTDYSKLDEDEMVILYKQLFRKRLIGTGGDLKISINEKTLGEDEEVEKLDEWRKIAFLVLNYFKGGYVAVNGGSIEEHQTNYNKLDNSPSQGIRALDSLAEILPLQAEKKGDSLQSEAVKKNIDKKEKKPPLPNSFFSEYVN